MILKMSWRNVWRNKIRSVVIMLSVSIGLVSGIFVLGLYKGMIKSRVRKVINYEIGHLQIHHPLFKKEYDPKYFIPESAAVIKKIKSITTIKNMAIRTITSGMLSSTTGSNGIQINGIEPVVENQVSGLAQKLIAGKYFSTDKKNEIIIGKKLADKLKLTIGKKIVLTFNDTANNIVTAAFKICGIYESGNLQFDEYNVYIRLNTINDLLLTPNTLNELSIILYKDEQLEATKKMLKSYFPFLLIETWKEISPETDLMVKTVDDYSYIIIVIILIALSFGIINTMLMSVLERTKEIGVMIALGTSKLRIISLIVYETAILTLSGIPLGFTAAYMLIGYFEKTGIDFSKSGKEMMASFGFDAIIYPLFPNEKIMTITIMTIVISFVSCLLPVIKAIQLKPAEALQK